MTVTPNMSLNRSTSFHSRPLNTAAPKTTTESIANNLGKLALINAESREGFLCVEYSKLLALALPSLRYMAKTAHIQ